ncbi:MAG TPA: hypothetical protein PKI03_06695 [Pseudomonadota bacterium]|nr:hypothetical protein [Pseudomonadota bacterium]
MAAQLCTAEFGPGSHMCMMDELYESVATGVLGATATIPRSWVYMPNWNKPTTNPEQPAQGVADNCQGYTYPLGARGWVGVVVEWRALPDGTPGLRWHSGGEASCSSLLPIACCRF